MTVLASRPRIDALPEYTEFSDTGCDLYASCLHCPLPRCRYDEPGGAPAIRRAERDTAMRRLADDERLSVDDLAERFGVSRRTVFRVLSATRRCDCEERGCRCKDGPAAA